MTLQLSHRPLHLMLAGTIAVLLGSTAVADPLPKVETTFGNGAVLRFYGQINKGFLNYNDGQVSDSYNFIDNANSNTRFGLTYTATINDQWDYLGTLEIQYQPYSTNNSAAPINLRTPQPPASAYEFSNANIRQIDNRLTNKEVGVFYLGQGNMASNDTVKVDFSGTTVIAGVAVADSAGTQLLRQADGTLSRLQIRNAFADFNGLGRKVRVRYDSPSFNGFVFRASYGQDQLSTNQNVQDDPLYDVSVAYTGESGDFKYGAQASYSWADAKATDVTTTILNGSASILHSPTGLNFTVASANRDNEVLESSFWYVKGGWIGELVSWGKTAVSLDYYSGSDIQSAGSESESTGLALVQNVTNWNTEFWVTYRSYDFATTKVAYDSSDALFFGARFRF